jgi:hypothetical protein
MLDGEFKPARKGITADDSGAQRTRSHGASI